MTETFFAASILLASLAMTYSCCLRPMRSSTHCCARTRKASEVHHLRQEVKALQAEADYIGKPTGQ